MSYNQLNKITIPTFEGIKIIPIDSIVYLEASNNYTIIHLKEEDSVLVSRGLKEFEKIFESTLFLRIHRASIINLVHLKECIQKETFYAVMVSGERIEVSRRRKKLLIERLRQYTIVLEPH